MKQRIDSSWTRRLARQKRRRKRTARRLSIFGALLLTALVIFSSCRRDKAPQIEICIADGFGGAECDLPGKGKYYKKPSELENYWMTNQDDMARLTSWCYGTSIDRAKSELEELKQKIFLEDLEQAKSQEQNTSRELEAEADSSEASQPQTPQQMQTQRDFAKP